MDYSRRQFTKGLAVLGAGTVVTGSSMRVASEPPPETTRLKILLRRFNICPAGLLILAKEALHQEGFTEVQYVVKPTVAEYFQGLISGEGDIGIQFAAPAIVYEGVPISFLAGAHAGCLYLVRGRAIRDLRGKTIVLRDLRGKTIAVPAVRSSQYSFAPSKLAHAPNEVNWVTHPPADSLRLLTEGKVDALLAIPPEAQEQGAKTIGHVVVDTMMDRHRALLRAPSSRGRHDQSSPQKIIAPGADWRFLNELEKS